MHIPVEDDGQDDARGKGALCGGSEHFDFPVSTQAKDPEKKLHSRPQNTLQRLISAITRTPDFCKNPPFLP
jgi:hypothetical protein